MSKWRREHEVSRQVTAQPTKTPTGSSSHEMAMQIVAIDPAVAQTWLAFNRGNRPLSDALVDRYAADMRAGRWKVTHQGIAFDPDGNLLDGQHRLKAIAVANVTVVMAVFRDCNRDTFDRLDSGRKRSAADAIAIDGIDSARSVAAIARSVILYGFKDSSISDAFVVEFARAHRDELLEYVPLVPMLTAPGAAAFAYAETDANLRPAVRRLIDNVGGQEMEDLHRCIKLMSSSAGASSQRARYKLAMGAIIKASGARP